MSKPFFLLTLFFLLVLVSCATPGRGTKPEEDVKDGTGIPGEPQGPLISPTSPLADEEKVFELLHPPLDREKASLVNEKPRVSPYPVIPPQVPEPVLVMERPATPQKPTLVPVQAPTSKTPAQTVGEVAAPSPGAPAEVVPGTAQPPIRNPALLPRPPVLPSSLLKAPPEPDLTPRPSQVPQPQVEYEDVTARPGDEVYFQFTPQGWTFSDKNQNGRAAGYVSMDLKDPARTVYLFRPEIPGTYPLEFQRADLVTGLTRIRHIRLQVVGPGEIIRESQMVSEDTGALLDKGLKLEKAGKHQEALDLYLANYNADSQELNWRLAGLSLILGRQGEAEAYWTRNLESDGSWTEPSWKELVSSLVRRGATEEGAVWARWGMDKKYLLPEDTFLRLADQLGYKGMVSEALEWLEEYSAWYPGSRKADQALFLRAQFLEREGPHRNIREALRLYRRIQTEYPLSSRWNASVERAGDLERQFLRIR